ncbi:ABC transporter permease [Streptomyces sp. MBT65]|uniref:ABC transporter permease n=1 Tax=Streptomyces sp. MBT65 TaxID=1488395 RepID=UPI0027DA5CEE|nr:ABC transporter permease [Streptomyces sp. MBT65]
MPPWRNPPPAKAVRSLRRPRRGTGSPLLAACGGSGGHGSTALGISIGIATMIVVTGIPASSQKALMEQLFAPGTNMLQVAPVPNQTPPVELPPRSVDMVRRIGPVTTAGAVANTRAEVFGRFLSASTEKFPTAVLGSVAATRMGVARIVPGRPAPQIYVDQRWFTVIGILARTPLSPDIDRSVPVGRDAARTRLGFTGHPTVIDVKAREDGIDAVRNVLAPTVCPELP